MQTTRTTRPGRPSIAQTGARGRSIYKGDDGSPIHGSLICIYIYMYMYIYIYVYIYVYIYIYILVINSRMICDITFISLTTFNSQAER